MTYDIYFNPHKRLFSVRKDRHAMTHANYVVMEAPRFFVSEAGRQRVLREKSKNVHAAIRSETLDRASMVTDIETETLVRLWQHTVRLTQHERSEHGRVVEVTYDPYKAGTFFDRNTGEPVTEAIGLVAIVHNSKPHVFVTLP